MKYDYSARTHVGQQRGKNEDSLVAQVVNDRFIGAVADGMGGHQAGEKASRLAVDAIKEVAQELSETQAVSEVLVAAVESANRQILEASLQDRQLAGMGTTLTGAVVEPGRAWLAHVGDSRAYLFRNGQIAQLTADHSLVEELVRRGHLSESEAHLHPQRNLLLQALGVVPQVEVETQEEILQPGDVLLLCSDGLTNMVSDRDIADIITAAPTLEAAAEKLISTANKRGGHDNITVVLVRCPQEGPTGPVADSSPAWSGQAPEPACQRFGCATLLLFYRGTFRQRPHGSLWRKAWLGLGLLVGLLGGGRYLSQAYLQRQFYLGTTSQGEVVLYQGWPRFLAGRPLFRVYQPMHVSIGQVKERYQESLRQGILVSSPQEGCQRLQEILQPHAENGKASNPL